jgi:hypothetical protein
MNVSFTTVILNNDNNADLDDLRLSIKLSVICDINHIPVLDNGFPIIIQQVKEFKGRRSFGRLCLEDNFLILPNIKTLNACAIQAAQGNITMAMSQAIWEKAKQDKLDAAATIKVEFAADSNLFQIMEVLDDMGVKKYSFRNPELLKTRLGDYFTSSNHSLSVRNQFHAKLTKLNFNRERFCNDYKTYLEDQKMVTDGVTEAPEATLTLF